VSNVNSANMNFDLKTLLDKGKTDLKFYIVDN